MMNIHRNYETMRPKVTAAFRKLRKAGFFARQNFQDCMSCGCAAVPNTAGKWMFYHQQDRERFKEFGELCLAFGGLDKKGKDLPDDEVKKIGKEIIAVFHEVGLHTEWNGKVSQRIIVKA